MVGSSSEGGTNVTVVRTDCIAAMLFLRYEG